MSAKTNAQVARESPFWAEMRAFERQSEQDARESPQFGVTKGAYVTRESLFWAEMRAFERQKKSVPKPVRRLLVNRLNCDF